MIEFKGRKMLKGRMISIEEINKLNSLEDKILLLKERVKEYQLLCYREPNL